MSDLDEPVSRRQFVRAAAGCVGGVAAASAIGGWSATQPSLAENAPQCPGGRPRIGCVSWCFHSFRGGSSPEEAIDIMGRIGFEGTDLILLAREDIDGFWTDRKVGNIKRQLERNKLEVAQFVIFQPVVGGLPSADRDERERNLDYFEAGCRIGRKLGAPIIDIVAPWPRELSGPRDYLPRYYDIEDPDPGEKFHIDIAPDFHWDRTWETFVNVVKACLERVKAHGMKLTIEHHTHTIIPNADAFLLLWSAIRDPALGYNLDTGWTLSQREYPPLAIHKVAPHLMNLHVRDIDGLMRKFVHIGEGVMDFKAVAESLKKIGFTGFLSVEQDKHPGDMEKTCRRYVAMMREHLS
jgi:sugar phosphate isomerase/epimerase